VVRCMEPSTVHGVLKERDGVPLLVLGGQHEVRGALIFFREGAEVEAYTRVSDIEPEKVYRWDEVDVDTPDGEAVRANALIGRRPGRGTADLEHHEEWDGRSDPLFTDALDEVGRLLRENPDFGEDYTALFRLHMAYNLLWTAIERYAGLRYHLGKRAVEKVRQIAGAPAFPELLKKHVSRSSEVFGSADLGRNVLDPEAPERAIDYYYAVRSNAVHRGKVVFRDFDMLRDSTSELLAIFRGLLAQSLGQAEARSRPNTTGRTQA